MAFDYLVIENFVEVERGKESRQGPGMSQKAIKWYIDKLWKIMMNDRKILPQTVFCKPANAGGMYQIKLPILKGKSEES